jgi:hypothetical protein
MEFFSFFMEIVHLLLGVAVDLTFVEVKFELLELVFEPVVLYEDSLEFFLNSSSFSKGSVFLEKRVNLWNKFELSLGL